MKIAVIGGGIFGVTIASKLAKSNSVDLYEQENDILKSASGINQYRLHRGYHYPRSSSTTIGVINSEPLFKNEYKSAIIENVDHYYCIAKEKSLTSSQQFQNFCRNYNLEFVKSKLELVNFDKIELCVKVKEDLFDPFLLKHACWEKLKTSNVNVLLNTKAESKIFSNYDFVVISNYASMNKILADYPQSQLEFQFEICEKPVVKLPSSFNRTSIVIMDGPFMCVDPFGNSNNFVLGNVEHAIHSRNTGKIPLIDEKFKPLLNNGVIRNPSITNFDLFISAAKEFLPEIKDAEHIGSMYTIRVVPPHVDKTDERPTIIKKIDNHIVTVFSGKIPTCVNTANEISKMVNDIK